MVRLTLDADDPDGRSVVLEGETATEVLDKWNALPWWSSYDGPQFAQRLIEYFGLDDPKYVSEPVEFPVDDDELLAKVAESSPGKIKLEEF